MSVSKDPRKSNSPKPEVSSAAIQRRLKNLTRRLNQMTTQCNELKHQLKASEKRLERAEQRLQLAQIELLEQNSHDKRDNAPLFGVERPIPGHHFSTKLIAISIELGKRVGFRAAADVLRIMFKALGISQKAPSHDAIEQWTLRFGVSSLQNTFTPEQRVLWMADHSSQIGSERVLLIIGIALDDLPSIGDTLDFENIKVLAVVPGDNWKTEDVAREYAKLAKKIGSPVYLLCDGACELRDAAETLEKDGKKTIVLGDLKHYAANLLEKEIGKSERFQSFITQVGLTRSRIQQTELSHFSPPTQRQKSRFMNLGPMLQWATMVLYHLAHPESPSQKGVEPQRMEAKLGWLREYVDDVAQWGQCQEVINRSLAVINRRGPDSGTAEEVDEALREANPDWRSEETAASRIGCRIIDWIRESASKLHAGDRAWISTEILESLFGRFKQLERQHSKGGFTRLIGAIPALCKTVTASMVRECFSRLNSKELRQWIADQLGTTLTARRKAAYHESRKKTPSQIPSLA